MKTMILVLVIACVSLVQAEDKLFDDAKATNAVAVLRVHRVHARPVVSDSSFVRYTVAPQHVYKNESNERLGHTINVHGFSDRDGVPPGECTIYIAKYDVPNRRFDQTNGTIWMLVEGGGTNAVSHVGGKEGSR
jgi:hypothetical protein